MRPFAAELKPVPLVSTLYPDEVRKLRKRNWLLKQENEVLSKVTAYLSRASLKVGGSRTMYPLDLNRPGMSGLFVLCLYPAGRRRFRAS